MFFMKGLKMKVSSWIIALFAGLVLFSCEQPEKPINWDEISDADFNIENQIVVQYCEDSILSSLGQEFTEKVFEQSAAMQLSAEDLAKYKNGRLIKVLVGLNGADKNQATTEYRDLKVWVRRGEIDSENVWEQSFNGEITLQAWNEVVAQEYYRLNNLQTDLFIGYTIQANALPIGTDGADASMSSVNKKGCWIYNCDNGRWIQHDANGHISIKAVFAGDALPKVEMSGIKTPSYIKPNTSFPIALTVKNLVDEELASFDVIIKSGNDEIASKTIELPWTLRKNESMSVFVEDLKIKKEGEYTISYSIEGINGKENSGAKVSLTRKIIVADNLVDRVVLLENTTGDNCSNCPSGHNYIKAAIEAAGADNYIWMAHHAGYNAGKYTSNQSDTVARIFYNTPMTYAPGLMIDRTNLLSVGVTTSGAPGGPIFSVNEVASRGVLADYFRLMQAEMSPIALDVKHIYNADTRELAVTVNGDILAEIPDRDRLAVGIVLLEDSLKGTQAGVSGAYYHMHVCRDGLSSVLGTLVQGEGNSFEVTKTKVLKDTYVPENMTLVVWVANKPTKMEKCDEYKVYQAYKVKLVQ